MDDDGIPGGEVRGEPGAELPAGRASSFFWSPPASRGRILRTGTILLETLRCIVRQPALTLGLPLVVCLALYPFYFLPVWGAWSHLAGLLVRFLVTGAAIPSAVAVVSWGIYRRLEERRSVSVDESVRAILPQWRPVLLLGLLWEVVVVAGLSCSVVPGILAFALLLASMPALVVERSGSAETAALRSLSLTRGHRFELFWMTVLLFVPVALLFRGVMQFEANVMLGVVAATAHRQGRMLLTLILTLSTGFLGALAGVTYFQLSRLENPPGGSS